MTSPDKPPVPTTPILSDSRRDANEAVSWGMRVAAAWTWRLLLVGLGLYVLAQIFIRIELVAFSFVLALFLTAVLHPLERVLRRTLPGPKSLSAALALLIGILALAGIAAFVSWQISSHADQLANQISNSFDKARHWLQTGPLHLKSTDLNKLSASITDALRTHQGQLISSAIATVRTLAEGLGALLLILLSTFFLLRDGDHIWTWTLGLLPKPAQERADVSGRAGWRTFGGYMRGVVLIALFHGVSVTIVLFVLRVPLAAALGVLIFLGSFIPIIGLTVTGALCVLVAMLEHGLTSGIVVAVAIIVLIQLEAHLLQPVIMSRSVEVHPIAIALSVLTGTILAGIPGALLAVPLVAFLNATIHALRDTPALPIADSGFPVAHRESPRGDPVDGAEPSAAAEQPKDAPTG
ncbi:MAG: AI-2E family transporter [Actinomycetota bacterium]|nr:AI-2E family transporter [Actinomycetota bacterium]